MLPKEKFKLTVEVEPEYATYYSASWFCEFGDEFIELSEHPKIKSSSSKKHNIKTIKALKTGSSRISVRIDKLVILINITVTDRIPGIKDYINYHTFYPYSQRKPTSETVVIDNNVDKMNGCTFAGWSTQRNSKSIAYKPGEEYNGDKSLELYPIWERIKFTLTYDANGGNNAPNAQTIEYDIMSNLSDVTPERKGYVFLGWSENKSPQSAVFQPKGEFAARRDVTLFAMWEYRRLLNIDPSIMWCQTGGWWGEENDGSDRCSLTACATMASINTGFVVYPYDVEYLCVSMTVNGVKYLRSENYNGGYIPYKKYTENGGTHYGYNGYGFSSLEEILEIINYELKNDRAIVIKTNGYGEHWVTVTGTVTGGIVKSFDDLIGIDPWFNGTNTCNPIISEFEGANNPDQSGIIQLKNGIKAINKQPPDFLDYRVFTLNLK